MTDRHYFMLAVLGYGASVLYSVFLWRKGFRRDNRVIYLLLFGAFACHTVALVKRGYSFSRCPVSTPYEATAFVTWVMTGAYLVLGLWRRLRFTGAFASPVLFALGVFALMPGLDDRAAEPGLRNVLASLHASIILLAYGAFGLAAVAALMYLSQQHSLKFDKVRAVMSLLPSIQRLELVMFRAVVVGFALLTAGLLLGTGGLRHSQGVFFVVDPKIIWSIVVWLFYLGLLVVRWRLGSSGRHLAWSVVGSFCFIMLTFWGFNLLSEIHNP